MSDFLLILVVTSPLWPIALATLLMTVRRPIIRLYDDFEAGEMLHEEIARRAEMRRERRRVMAVIEGHGARQDLAGRAVVREKISRERARRMGILAAEGRRLTVSSRRLRR